jgi:hypothetical protein
VKTILLLLPLIVSCSKFAQELPINEIEVLTVENKNWKFICENNIVKTKEGNQLTIAFDMNNNIIRCRE